MGKARGHLQVAHGLSPESYRIRRALAELDFDQAIQDPALDPKGRREKLMSSLRQIDGAIGALRVYRRDVKEAETAADAVSTDDSPFAGGRFRTGLRSTQRQLIEEEAGLHFLAGRSLGALQKDAQAFEAYRKARELSPQNPMYIAAEDVWRTRATTKDGEPGTAPAPARAGGGGTKTPPPPTGPAAAPKKRTGREADGSR